MKLNAHKTKIAIAGIVFVLLAITLIQRRVPSKKISPEVIADMKKREMQTSKYQKRKSQL